MAKWHWQVFIPLDLVLNNSKAPLEHCMAFLNEKKMGVRVLVLGALTLGELLINLCAC